MKKAASLLCLILLASLLSTIIQPVAADSLSILTDKPSYSGTASIQVSGVVSIAAPTNASTAVVITTTNPSGAVVDYGEAPVSSLSGRLQGVFNYSLVAGGTPSWTDGIYTVSATWGNPNGGSLNGTTTFRYLATTVSTTTSTTSSSSSSSSSTTTASSTSSSSTKSSSTSSALSTTISASPSHSVAGKFDASISGGSILNSTYDAQNETYHITARSPANATLEVVIPTGLYAQDFFFVSGPPTGSETFDSQDNTLDVNFQTYLYMSISPPPASGNTMSTFDIATVDSGIQILDQFRIAPVVINGVTAYAVYYQTPSSSLACTNQLAEGSSSNCIAYPFQPVTDPTGTYTITFGFDINGQVFFIVQSTKALNVIVSAYQLQNGQVIQLTPDQVPSTPYYVDVPMPVATAFDVHLGAACQTSLVAVGCEDLGALEWSLSAGGIISLEFIGLNNQPLASGAVTTTDLPILAIQGTQGAISVQGLTLNTDTNTFRIYGTEQPAVSQLAGNQYGPIQLNLQPTLNIKTSSNPKEPPTAMGQPFAGWDWVSLTFTEPPSIPNFSFNYTINGYQPGSLLFATESGVDPAFVQPATCTGGVCVIEFEPDRAGVFQVEVTSQTFSGTYQGGYTFVAQANALDAGVPIGGTMAVMSVGLFVVFRRRSSRTENPRDYNGGKKW